MALTNRETLTALAVSTLVVFSVEVLVYSMDKSKDGKFTLHMPPLNQAIKVLGLIIGTNITANLITGFINERSLSNAEKSLSDLYETEKDKVRSGLIQGQKATQILWSPIG